VLERVDYTWDGTHLIEQTTAESRTRWHYQPNTYTPITQAVDDHTGPPTVRAVITDAVGTPSELIDPATAHITATAT
ncbi:hypothetical protein, partial [Nocardia cerradoensis]|uniref:hypothetical protein n=1 Tax=Nocardia cerradoensis TaxID=85688 RepID=UPI001674021A